jgi:hypothetical protein
MYRNSKIDKPSCANQTVSIILVLVFDRLRDKGNGGADKERLGVVEADEAQSRENHRYQWPTHAMEYSIEQGISP